MSVYPGVLEDKGSHTADSVSSKMKMKTLANGAEVVNSPMKILHINANLKRIVHTRNPRGLSADKG